MEDDRFIYDVLEEFFGFSQFKSKEQQKAVEWALKKESDVFVSMPPGSGKSICFLLPALLTNKITIVVEPQLAIIEDQIYSLSLLNIEAVTINSTISKTQAGRIIKDLRCAYPSSKILYLTPEGLNESMIIDFIDKLVEIDRMGYFVIDDAHCIPRWAETSRPAYQQLGQLRVKYPNITWLIMTAPNSMEEVSNILHELQLTQPVTMICSPTYRPTIKYDTVNKSNIGNELEHLGSCIKQWLGDSMLELGDPDRSSGIIYCHKRADVDSLSNALLWKEGVFALAYHSGLTAEERSNILQSWQQGSQAVLCATIDTFGMGMHKTNLRFVIHWNVPKSLSTFYQESGRVSADGRESYCRIYYSDIEATHIQSLMSTNEERNQFNIMLNLCKSSCCWHKSFANHFGEKTLVCSSSCNAKRKLTYSLNNETNEDSKKEIKIEDEVEKKTINVDVKQENNLNLNSEMVKKMNETPTQGKIINSFKSEILEDMQMTNDETKKVKNYINPNDINKLTNVNSINKYEIFDNDDNTTIIYNQPIKIEDQEDSKPNVKMMVMESNIIELNSSKCTVEWLAEDKIKEGSIVNLKDLLQKVPSPVDISWNNMVNNNSLSYANETATLASASVSQQCNLNWAQFKSKPYNNINYVPIKNMESTKFNGGSIVGRQNSIEPAPSCFNTGMTAATATATATAGRMPGDMKIDPNTFLYEMQKFVVKGNKTTVMAQDSGIETKMSGGFISVEGNEHNLARNPIARTSKRKRRNTTTPKATKRSRKTEKETRTK